MVRGTVGLIVLGAALLLSGCGPEALRTAPLPEALTASAPYAPQVALDSALRDTVNQYRREWLLPGAAFATFTCESRRLAWDGVTRTGTDTPLGPHALFPLEWQVAPMIATTAIRLERRGVLRLDAPLRELWPDAARGAPWYADVTLAQLLSYRPRIPAFYLKDSAALVPPFTPSRIQPATRTAARWFLSQQPDSVHTGIGSSLPALVVANGILEEVTGASIQQLLIEEVFAPLGLRARFVPRGEYGPNQPHGHAVHGGETVTAWQPTTPRRYHTLLEASELAISLPDYVSFLQAHLCAVQGKRNALLTQAEALRLYGADTEDADATPLGWSGANWDLDPVRLSPGGGSGFNALGGFSKLSLRGAVALMNVNGIFANYATGWVLFDALGLPPAFPQSRSQIPGR